MGHQELFPARPGPLRGQRSTAPLRENGLGLIVQPGEQGGHPRFRSPTEALEDLRRGLRDGKSGLFPHQPGEALGPLAHAEDDPAPGGGAELPRDQGGGVDGPPGIDRPPLALFHLGTDVLEGTMEEGPPVGHQDLDDRFPDGQRLLGPDQILEGEALGEGVLPAQDRCT